MNSGELASNFSFKPIDLDISSSSSESFDAEPVSPNTIFRYFGEGDNNDCQSLRRANPIKEHSSGEEDMMGLEPSESRVISPYPFSHQPSREELEEREQLTSAFGWKLHPRVEEYQEDERQHHYVDYSLYFPTSNEQEMECDDFSISSNEASSLSDDLETISKDPASFWEDGIEPVSTDRAESPTEVSLGSSDSESPRAHSQVAFFGTDRTSS